MTEQVKGISSDGVTRRSFLGKTSAALVAAASVPILAAAQQTKDLSRDSHTGINEQELGPKNPGLEAQEPDSIYPPVTDSGGQPPFKYPFAMAHKRIEAGGWTRQVTVRDFPLSKKIFGRLAFGNVDTRADISTEGAIGFEPRDAIINNPAVFSIKAAQAVLDFKICSRVKCCRISGKTRLQVVWMNPRYPAISQFLFHRSASEV